MSIEKLFTEKQWLKIAKNAEAAGHSILRHSCGFAIFAPTTLIDDVFRNAGEEKCSVCNATTYIFYSQWKKDGWYPVCCPCFKR